MPRTVLVVDDDPLVLETVAMMLEELGCEVLCSENATDALRKLAADETIEILISDINMPGLSGYELAEQAKRLRRELRIILLSGREHDGHGYPLVQKPFVKHDLARVMSRTTGLC